MAAFLPSTPLPSTPVLADAESIFISAPYGIIVNSKDQLDLSPRYLLAIRELVKHSARAKCKLEYKKFYHCAKEHPILVTFKCTAVYEELSKCLGQYTRPEDFENMKQKYIDGIIEIPVSMFDRPEDSMTYGR